MTSLQYIANDIREFLPSAKAAWLYGSMARREAGPDSDVDVAVLFDAASSKDAWQLSKDASLLSARWGQSVDLIDLRQAPCVLQKEIIQAHYRLFANDKVLADDYELFALSQYRDFSERFAQEFARIALSGKVLERTNG